MFLENVSVQLLDVLVFRQKTGRYHTKKRAFAALSFREISDSRYIYRGTQLSAHSGDISFVPAGVAYDRVTEAEEIIVIHFSMLNCAEDEIRVFTPADPARYRAMFRRILDVWTEKPRGYRSAATAIFYEILAQMQYDRLGEEEARDSRIRETARYMQANFHDPSLSIAALARRACISEALLRRDFRKTYGTSPKDYLDNLRMQYAVSLLGAGYFTQTEIAQRCGYADVKYFRTAFRRRMGVCLSQYEYHFNHESIRLPDEDEP